MRKHSNQRALNVIRSLRLRQQKQMQQIDILCHDMVSAHQQFSVKLSQMLQVTRFYETLLSCATLQDILDTAFASFGASIPFCRAAFFLPDENGFEIHRPKELISDDHALPPHDWFSPQLVTDISLSPRVCSLDEMLRMGMQGTPLVLKTISAAAIPLSRCGQAAGFVFLYRSAATPLTSRELASASSISAGLCRAILNLPSGVKQVL